MSGGKKSINTPSPSVHYNHKPQHILFGFYVIVKVEARGSKVIHSGLYFIILFN